MSAGDLRELAIRRQDVANGTGELVAGVVLRVWVDDQDETNPDDVLAFELSIPDGPSGGWAAGVVHDVIEDALRILELEQ